uniref:Uncharacterized protein n=1 Tax=Amphora coffeiformis TaxID=265554 RepID=A0A7S3KZG7_9STRA|mmetsp:Transcript_7629/g.14493  ORF Transcript_7629/g.14493 Transcript_7629/m.14493 type:complete len:174 (+) Transcript_7629:75-596(+)|eukprot:scaffold1684_cov214-Amphora_coffeaeformis.AAC.25
MPTTEDNFPEDLTMQGQDETNQNEAQLIEEGNAENGTASASASASALDGSTGRNRSHTREARAPSTVLMQEDIGCSLPPPSSMLSMPLYLPSVTRQHPHQVTPPSFWAASDQPSSSRMTRPRLIQILNEALRLMDDMDDEESFMENCHHHHHHHDQQDDDNDLAHHQPRGFQG